MKRIGMTIGIRPEKIEEYKYLHAHVWPEVLKNLKKLNCRNYSIFLHNNILFGYMEYYGTDFDSEMEKMAADPITQKWWEICMPCQTKVASAKEYEHWSMMEEVFYFDPNL